MTTPYRYLVHPHIAQRKSQPAPQIEQEHVGFNGRVALIVTRAVGNMWAAYVFAAWALLYLPTALKGGLPTIVVWVAQTFMQLVLLSVILVGQNIQGRAADKRSIMTYEDADATFHEAAEIQKHLLEQDASLGVLLHQAQQILKGLEDISESGPAPSR